MAMRDPKTGKFLRRVKEALQNSKPVTLEAQFADQVKINVVPAMKTNAQHSARRSTIMTASVTVIGNLVADPELRQTNNGKSVMNFSLAYTPRKPDGTDGQTSFYDITAWEYLADNIAASVKKGDRLIVVGRLSQQKYQDNDGNNRTKLVITADEVGGTMRFHTIEMSRTAKRNAPVAEPVVEETPAEGEDIFA